MMTELLRPDPNAPPSLDLLRLGLVRLVLPCVVVLSLLLLPPSSAEPTQFGLPDGYSFHYGVRDHTGGAEFSHTETRRDLLTVGSYRVRLPDGRTQIVHYKADHRGYRAIVTYEDNASAVALGSIEDASTKSNENSFFENDHKNILFDLTSTVSGETSNSETVTQKPQPNVLLKKIFQPSELQKVTIAAPPGKLFNETTRLWNPINHIPTLSGKHRKEESAIEQDIPFKGSVGLAISPKETNQDFNTTDTTNKNELLPNTISVGSQFQNLSSAASTNVSEKSNILGTASLNHVHSESDDQSLFHKTAATGVLSVSTVPSDHVSSNDPRVPQVPEASRVPIPSRVPMTFSNPELPHTATVPHKPRVPSIPTVSHDLENLHVFTVPHDTSSSQISPVPQVPTAPRIPTVPHNPSVPEVPTVAQNSTALKVSTVSRVPIVPNVPTNQRIPTVPHIPTVPELPTVPNPPTLPHIPTVPRVPTVPHIPTVPHVPTVPPPLSHKRLSHTEIVAQRLQGRAQGRWPPLAPKEGRWPPLAQKEGRWPPVANKEGRWPPLSVPPVNKIPFQASQDQWHPIPISASSSSLNQPTHQHPHPPVHRLPHPNSSHRYGENLNSYKTGNTNAHGLHSNRLYGSLHANTSVSPSLSHIYSSPGHVNHVLPALLTQFEPPSINANKNNNLESLFISMELFKPKTNTSLNIPQPEGDIGNDIEPNRHETYHFPYDTSHKSHEKSSEESDGSRHETFEFSAVKENQNRNSIESSFESSSKKPARRRPFIVDPDASVFHQSPSVFVDFAQKGNQLKESSITESLIAPYVIVGGAYPTNPYAKYYIQQTLEEDPNSVANHGIRPADAKDSGNVLLPPEALPPHLANIRQSPKTRVSTGDLPLRDQPSTFGGGERSGEFTPNSLLSPRLSRRRRASRSGLSLWFDIYENG